jgi:hypothetical protein
VQALLASQIKVRQSLTSSFIMQQTQKNLPRFKNEAGFFIACKGEFIRPYNYL